MELPAAAGVLTEVNPVLKFDKNMKVDYSEMTVMNEYFILESVDLNEETNELSLHLRWKDQTQAIDPVTANPMCILSGIKLTPKDDAAWDSKERLNVVNTGSIGYDIYLRANALYSFAQKPENQEKFGLYPFVNPDVIIGGAPESGGHFADTYKDFTDQYTLNKGQKNGWVYEDGGYAYYENGERYTGVKKVGQFYYDFGETGINIGQTKFTGIFQIDGINHYSKDGLLTSGWYTVDDKSYCFDENGKGLDGKVIIDEVELEFENGLLIGGYTGFIKKTDGNTYYYQNGKKTFGWLYVGEDLYHFNTDTGVMTTGTHVIPDNEAKAKGAYYDFAEDGRTLRGYFNGHGYYYWAGLPRLNDWVKHGGDKDPEAWYHTNGNGHYVTDPTGQHTFKLTLNGKTYTAVKIAYDGVVYTFDNTNGKLLLGSFVVGEDGELYYYWAGKPVNEGWFEVNGDTYYAYPDGHLARGCHTIDGKVYMFNDKGVLVTEGVMILASLTDRYEKLKVKITNTVEGTESVRIAVWGVNAGQGAGLFWIDAVKNADGVWEAELPMCKFNMSTADVFAMHVYGKVNGTDGVLVTSSISVPVAVQHVYE